MGKINRKKFLKKACLTSVCMCGFTALAMHSGSSESALSDNGAGDTTTDLLREWIRQTLGYLNQNIPEAELKKFIKQNAVLHFKQLKMEEILLPFVGDVDGFIAFLENSWGWKVKNNRTTQKIIADENKNYCVCPLLDAQQKGSSIICYCSEGFAEKMFSKVMNHDVRATVMASVRRGDKSCRYEIDYH